MGGRGTPMQAGASGGVDLGLGADAFRAGTGGGAMPTPGLEFGLRHDADDAGTGTGAGFGGRVTHTDAGSGLGVDARVRRLLAHGDPDYRERAASGSIRLVPDERGRGLPATRRGSAGNRNVHDAPASRPPSLRSRRPRDPVCRRPPPSERLPAVGPGREAPREAAA